MLSWIGSILVNDELIKSVWPVRIHRKIDSPRLTSFILRCAQRCLSQQSLDISLRNLLFVSTTISVLLILTRNRSIPVYAKIFRDLFVREGFDYDHVHDWTVLGYLTAMQRREELKSEDASAKDRVIRELFGVYGQMKTVCYLTQSPVDAVA